MGKLRLQPTLWTKSARVWARTGRLEVRVNLSLHWQKDSNLNLQYFQNRPPPPWLQVRAPTGIGQSRRPAGVEPNSALTHHLSYYITTPWSRPQSLAFTPPWRRSCQNLRLRESESCDDSESSMSHAHLPILTRLHCLSLAGANLMLRGIAAAFNDCGFCPAGGPGAAAAARRSS